MPQNLSEISPLQESSESKTSAEQARSALEQRRRLLLSEDVMVGIEKSHEQGDPQGVLALERAASSLEQSSLDKEKAYEVAQRQIESTLGPDGRWTDAIREVAARLNRGQRKKDGELPRSFDQVLGELKEYQQSLKDVARTDKNESADNQANALGYSISSAKRGDLEGIEGTLKYVETMLGSGLELSDHIRGAEDVRAQRDALFAEKQRLIALKTNESYQAQVQGEKESRVEETRVAVEQAFDTQPLYAVSSSAELGLGRGVLDAISETKKQQLSTLFSQFNGDRSQYVGETQVGEAKVQLVESNNKILEPQPDAEALVAETIESTKNPIVAEKPIEQARREVEAVLIEEPVVSQEVDEMRRTQAAQNIVGRYFNGASAPTMRTVIGKLSGELQAKPDDLYKRFQTGRIKVDRQTQMLISQLNSQGYQPNSPGWGNRNPNSMEGRVAVQSQQALEQILRRMLS